MFGDEKPSERSTHEAAWTETCSSKNPRRSSVGPKNKRLSV